MTAVYLSLITLLFIQAQGLLFGDRNNKAIKIIYFIQMNEPVSNLSVNIPTEEIERQPCTFSLKILRK